MKRNKIACFLTMVLIYVALLGGCVEVNKAPEAFFEFSPAYPTVGESVVFTDKSTDVDGKVVSWRWDFGDGSNGTGEQVAHVYATAGTYSVVLTVTDDDGAVDTCILEVTVSLPYEVTKDAAVDILMSELIKPGFSDKRVSAFMLSEPLQKDDVISSERGEVFVVEDKTWFVFIDDDPEADFAHETRYVSINATSGSIKSVNETWLPLINNISIWDVKNLSKGNLIGIYPILDSPVPISGGKSVAPSGDYGDAPDGQFAYYGVKGRFPTLYSTSNSVFGRHGGHTLVTGEEMLGVRVSAEVDANDSKDPDGRPNLVDADSDERMFVIVEGTTAKLSFTVTVDKGAPKVTRYVNVLIDFDQNGRWNMGSYGREWVVVNFEVDVDPGFSKTIITPSFGWGNKTILPSPVWMRVALTREKINDTLFPGGWDGSGQFRYGEIEDALVFLTDRVPHPGMPLWWGWWPPKPNTPPGGQPGGPGGGGPQAPPKPPQPPGPGVGPCGTPVNYHYLVINCGDNRKTSHMKPECDQLNKTFSDLGCTSLGYLGPDKSGNNRNTRDNIKNALEKIKDKVRCIDRVFILIKGHGDGENIYLYDSKGDDIGKIGFKEISEWLDIPPCEDLDCDKEEVCCHVSIVISSCYAGKATKNASEGGLSRKGRTVAVSSTDGKSYGRDGGYTAGFVRGMRENGSIEDAHKAGTDNQKKNHPGSNTDIENRECDCKCPCKPSVDVNKSVWDESLDGWVDEIDSSLGATVRFRCEIENNGTCRNVSELEMVDTLQPCLKYVENSTIIYLNGEPITPIEPTIEGYQLIWNLMEIGELAPGESIVVEFTAETIELGENINSVEGRALCTYDPTITVKDQDTAVVNVKDAIPPTTTKEVGEPSSHDGYKVTLLTPIWLNATDEGGSEVAYIYYEIWCDINGNGSIDPDEKVGNETIMGNNATIYLTDYIGEWDVLVELRWYAVDASENEEDMHYQNHYVIPL